MIDKVMHPWIGGIMLAAIFSAIMSTIDSQLLVSSSALSEDLYLKTLRRRASEKEVVWVGRACVVVTSIAALVIALVWDATVLEIVAFAWAGLGAAFGPVVLFALFSRRTSRQSALAGMLMGTVVLILWKLAGLSGSMYEIVPGFAVNCIVIMLVNSIVGQRDKEVLDEFEEVVETLKTR